jgi:hypothetical protein
VDSGISNRRLLAVLDEDRDAPAEQLVRDAAEMLIEPPRGTSASQMLYLPFVSSPVAKKRCRAYQVVGE